MATTLPLMSVPEHQNERYGKIQVEFQQKYGKPPIFYARAPGRVNLIGEHIDYCGYAVLPMAIEQDIVIAVRISQPGEIKLANYNSEYSDYTCKTSDISIDKGSPKWYHYFLCGYRGILEHFGMSESCGLELLLHGTVPRSAGLSSSSALVCCSGIATMHANDKCLSKLELAEICQKCERYIGTEGGGMDQAISFLAEAGTAKLIEFNPVRTRDVCLPDDAVFVISNSCVEMNKAATSHFNNRVTECRIATQILAKLKGLEWRKIYRLGELHEKLKVTLADMVTMVTELLHSESYSKQEVCDILEVTADELDHINPNQNSKLSAFKLHDRALHVYSEASRVWKFKKVCDEHPPDALQQLGELMNASHASCRDCYQCSCPQLDELVDLCVQSGALGSRLTGAGWGGCAVSLVPAHLVPDFLLKVTNGYYKKTESRMATLPESLFVTKPGHGAALYGAV